MTVVTKLSLYQLLFTLIFALVAYIFFGKLYAVSGLLGGLICSTANLTFAGKLFLGKSKVDPKQVLRQFYRSESLKLLFTFSMFVVVYKVFDIEFFTFILAYSLTTMLNWLCLPFLNDEIVIKESTKN